MISVEEGGQEPSATELAALIETARREKIHVLFAQPSYSSRTIETIARQIDARVVELNDLAPDWAANLRNVAQRLAEALNAH
jgi:zinc transport system substrate-binding protein